MSIFENFKEKLGFVDKQIKGQDIDIEKTVSEEIDFWTDLDESDSAAYSRLEKYWNNINVSNWNPNTPWSGAFVSYILRDHGFKGDGLHANYVEDVIDGQYPGWQAYNVPFNTYGENWIEVNVGDVFVKSRPGGFKAGHGDVVYRVDVPGQKAYLIGGNIGDTLSTHVLNLRDGMARFSGDSSNDYDVVLKREKKSHGWITIALAGGLAWMFLR